MRMFIVLIATAVLLSPTAPAQESSSPTLEYARDASTIVIQVDSWGGLRADDSFDATPLMRIYGNGRVLVQNSTKPKGERSYETWLTDAEMGELLRFLYDHGAMEYEYGIVKKRLKEEAARRRAATRTGRIEHRGGVSDANSISVEIFLKSYRPAGSDAETQSDFYHRTGGYGLIHMARDFPELEEAQKLAAVERKVWELTRNANLKPTTAPPADEQP